MRRDTATGIEDVVDFFGTYVRTVEQLQDFSLPFDAHYDYARPLDVVDDDVRNQQWQDAYHQRRLHALSPVAYAELHERYRFAETGLKLRVMAGSEERTMWHEITFLVFSRTENVTLSLIRYDRVTTYAKFRQVIYRDRGGAKGSPLTVDLFLLNGHLFVAQQEIRSHKHIDRRDVEAARQRALDSVALRRKLNALFADHE